MKNWHPLVFGPELACKGELHRHRSYAANHAEEAWGIVFLHEILVFKPGAINAEAPSTVAIQKVAALAHKVPNDAVK